MNFAKQKIIKVPILQLGDEDKDVDLRGADIRYDALMNKAGESLIGADKRWLNAILEDLDGADKLEAKESLIGANKLEASLYDEYYIPSSPYLERVRECSYHPFQIIPKKRWWSKLWGK